MSKDLYQYTSKNSAKIVAGDFGKIELSSLRSQPVESLRV